MQKLTHRYDWQHLLSSPDNFPKFMFDSSLLGNAVALGKSLVFDANAPGGIPLSTKHATQAFIQESPFVAVRALIDTFFICQKNVPQKISQLEELFGTRRWILELFKMEVGLEPVALPAASATLIVRVPALDDGGGDVAIAYRIAAALKKEFNNNTVVLLVTPGALEWAKRYAPSLSFDTPVVESHGIICAIDPLNLFGKKINGAFLNTLNDGVMLDYMSTSRISPPPFREVRFLLSDADYVGDSPCHSFIGFGPGSLGIPEALYPNLRTSLTADARHKLIERLTSRYGLQLKELVTEQHRWSGSYLHLAHSLQRHLEGLTGYAIREGVPVVNFDFSVVGMGDHKRRVTPSKIPEGCVALDLSKLQTLDARTAQQVRNAKVLHLVLPRIGEEDYISVLASADVPPLIRGITTAVELFHAGGSFNTELAYPNMEGLWNAMKMRAELIGAALPEQNVAYTTPRIFNAAFESLRSNINCGDYGNAGKRISMLVAALLQSRTN